MNANSLKNLKTLNHKEAQALGRKGGLASGIARAEKKTLKESLELMLSTMRKTETGETESTQDAILRKLIEQALDGNIQAYKEIKATLGQDNPFKYLQDERGEALENAFGSL